jgi:hypothetical protein
LSGITEAKILLHGLVRVAAKRPELEFYKADKLSGQKRLLAAFQKNI